MLDNILDNNNLKKTKQRKQVLESIQELKDNATIKKLESKCNIDTSTLYRIVELLLDKNILEKNINHNNEIYYSINEGHKHYITCIKCHKKIEMDICPIIEVENKLEKKGIKIIEHKINIECICKECQKEDL